MGIPKGLENLSNLSGVSLKGKKTYIAAAALALVAIWQILDAGTIDTNQILILANALGFAGLRNAL